MDYRIFGKQLYALNSGSPVYRHDRCEQVPWPHLSHKIQGKFWKEHVGILPSKEESFDEKTENSLGSSIQSFLLQKPGRIPCTTRLLNYPIHTKQTSNHQCVFRIVDGMYYRDHTERCVEPGKICNPTPGKAFLQGVFIKLPLGSKITRICLSMPFAKTFSTHVLDSIENNAYVAEQFINDSADAMMETGWHTVPFGILLTDSGFPIFIPRAIDIEIEWESPSPSSSSTAADVCCQFEIVHQQSEYSEIIKHYGLYVDNPTNQFIFFVPNALQVYEWNISDRSEWEIPCRQNFDEEIRSIILHGDISKIKRLGVYFKTDDCLEAADILSGIEPLELQRRTGQKFRKDFIRIPFTRSLWSLDCECGLTPRNGKLRVYVDTDIDSLKEEQFHVLLVSNLDYIIERI